MPEEIDTDDLNHETIDSIETERERPGKPQRVKPTRPTIEPPEIVSIEMSELEKETYAWMGISPLVKLGRELNNPKTAILNIVPVGSLPPEPIGDLVVTTPVEIATTAEPEPTEPPAVLDSPAADLDSLAEPPQSGIAPAAFTAPAAEESLAEPLGTRIAPPVAVVAVSEPPQPVTQIEVSLPTVEPVEELPENRRRKRRSSAVVD